jgi:beta-fructofuranosidase
VLRLEDRWVWDSWIADDGDRYHLFFLQAPLGLGDPELRHAAATIGHASSRDLITWDQHGTALEPSAAGWDDRALWTGSVARGDDGVWRLYYTGISHAGGVVYDQRIGLAESDDLVRWRRVGHAPLLEADPRWYKTVGGTVSETWRDPFVFRDLGGDGWHMLITARERGAPRLRDGVLAHARSADMRSWEIGPPVSRPGQFGQLEVAQVRLVDGRPLLVFTCGTEEQRAGDCCTWSVVGESLTGSWDVAAARPFRREPKLFAAPLVQRRDGGWALLGFLNQEAESVHTFEIVDPISVRLEGDELV